MREEKGGGRRNMTPSHGEPSKNPEKPFLNRTTTLTALVKCFMFFILYRSESGCIFLIP